MTNTSKPASPEALNSTYFGVTNRILLGSVETALWGVMPESREIAAAEIRLIIGMTQEILLRDKGIDVSWSVISESVYGINPKDLRRALNTY